MYEDITALRKEGKLDDALCLALEAFANNPIDIFARRAVAWCYYDIAKHNIANSQLPEYFDALRHLAQLEMPPDETIFHSSIGWLVRSAVTYCVENKIKDNSVFDDLFELLKQFSVNRTCDSYSFILISFLKTQSHWSGFLDFCDWWKFDEFRAEDYRPSQLENGTKMLSLVERAYIAYSKTVLARNDSDRMLSILPKLEALSAQHPDYVYIPYYRAKILLALDKSAQVIEFLKPFVKRKCNDFWVWELLGDAQSDDNCRLAFYCRALLCRAKPEMIVNLREKVADLFARLHFYEQAAREARWAMQTRERNGWRIPQNLSTIVATNQCNSLEANTDFYKKYAVQADIAVFGEYKWYAVLVSYVNDERNFVSFVTDNRIQGFFAAKSLPNVNDIIEIQTCENITNGLNKIKTWRVPDNPNRSAYFRMFDGNLHKQPNGFAIINNVFIPAFLCNDISTGKHVVGEAVISYDNKKNRWGWRAVSIASNE